MSKIRLAIGTASTGNVRIEFMESVLALQKALMTDVNLKVQDVCLLYYCSSVIPQNRTEIVRMAKKWKATHILWIDDDMRFPVEAAKALLWQAKKQRYGIIGANCIKRKYPIEWMACDFDGTEYVSADRTGVAKVLYTGNAFVLVDMKVYDTVPEPWFAFAYNEKTTNFGTEDVFFMTRAAQHGFDTYVDNDVSQLIDHIGYWTFTPQDKATTKPKNASTD